MANVLASLEANAPMGKAKTTDEKIKAIEDYLVQLLEQFRWTLNNLSADNFNEKEVVSWLNSTITEPIQVAIQSAEEDMRTEIQASAEGVVIDVHKEYATAWVSGTAYKVNDVIKRETTNDVGFYKCRQDHTAANTNRPPTGADWATYWSVVQPEDVLHTRFDVNASEIRSEVSRATGAEGDLSSAITQSADDIRLEVKGDYAKEWASGSSYYESDVVKVSTIVNGVVTAVNFYKAKSDHTAAAGNKPPNATYWESVSNATVQSMIDMSLNGITLSYDNTQVGSGEHNAAYIKLTKDGTEIAGGKVFIKDLDAGTINAGQLSADYIRGGTLDAGAINMDGAFTVKAIDAYDWASGKSYTTSDYVRKTVQISEYSQRVYYYHCISAHTSSASNAPPNSTYWTQVSQSSLPGIEVGTIGGHYSNNTGESSIELLSANGDNDVYISDECSSMDSTVGTGIRTVEVNEDMIELVAAESSSNRVRVWIEKDRITLKKTVNGTTTTYDLFDLLDQI